MIIYGYNDKSLGVSLKLYPFSQRITAGSPQGPVTCLATGPWPDNGVRYGARQIP